jgi:hypothetical protein
MRKSRVLLAGVAVAAAGAATSAFTASNDFTAVDNNVAGYGELAVTGVGVTNIAYTPSTSDAAKLHVVVFTVDTDTTAPNMSAKMTLYSGASVASAPTNSPCVSTTTTVTCTLSTDLLFTGFNKTGLTVTSN